MAEVELRKTIAQENIRLMSKKQDAMIAAGGEVSPLTEGLLAGIKAGAQRFATELTAGQLAQQADVPLGTPTHLGQVPGQPEPPKPGQGSNGAQRR
jgi:hypothetical protein